MTTSIAYLRNAFTLFCVSLVIGIALTVDWILSNKYDCLFFCQSYDLLVVNMESLFLLNDRFKRKAVFLTGLLETIVLSHINGTVLWLLIILILANNYAFHLFPLLKIAQVNLDLVALFSAVFYFLYTGFAFGFTLLLVGFVYYFQLKVLNVRFSKLVSSIKAGHFSSGRLMGSSLAYHWVAHRKIMTSVDRFNDDIIRLAARRSDDIRHPYNIYLLTAIVFTKNNLLFLLL
ncbi:hypothetical protein TYRP_022097 [Tyrophagus putrescentiae]|nr:hypothetical protein TYRP_022097 [Tyrophagus putrescentiae]